MVDVMARLCSLYEGKDRRCNSYEGDAGDQTNQRSTCVQHALAAVYTSTYCSDAIEAVIDLDVVTPLKAAKSRKAVKPIKSIKSIPSFKITRIKKPAASLTCLFCYDNPKRGRTQSLARSDSLRRHYRQLHFQY